jgi:hypothetical protein
MTDLFTQSLPADQPCDKTCPYFKEVIIGIDDFGCDRSYRYCALKHYYDFVYINETPDKFGCKLKEIK